ncbi:MAG: efflux RND transporter periplasmic adaptor subunit [Thalassobaculales bacterium]
MNRSYLYALLFTVAAAAWMISGQFGEKAEAQGAPAPASAAEPPAPAVRVALSEAAPHRRVLIVNGRTEASRKVELRARVDGRVAALPAERGADVAAGQELVRISPDDRPAQLAMAEAVLQQRRMEYDAAAQLAGRGFRAETQLAQTRAALESAKADLARIRLDIENLVVRAPFAARLSTRSVELGQSVKAGDPLVALVDLDPLVIAAAVSERDVGRLRLGDIGRARLITGEEIEGAIRYIAPSADAATRTFRVEIEAPNPAGRLPDGTTAALELALDTRMAHRLPSSVLSLDDAGRLGVKLVGEDDRVAFVPVTVIASDAEGLWIAGLPGRARIVVVGQAFVSAGQVVRPQTVELPRSTP